MPRSKDPAHTRIRPDDAKLEALAELAAGAGHEINNPLATISGRVQLLLRDEDDPARRQALLTIGAQAYRIRDMIGDLMLFARPPKPQPESLNLTEVLQTVLGRLAESAQARGCTFEVRAEDRVPIFADRTQLSVVISSLVHNSLEALTPFPSPWGRGERGEGGPVSITAQSVSEDDRPWALLAIGDRGPGLSEVDREHLFDPFYSGRQAGRGLGFGLPKCWRIVTNHGGRIEAVSVPGEATTFQVHWPAGERKADQG